MANRDAIGGEVVEVVLAWGDAVVATKYLRAEGAFTVGEADGCDALVPTEALGARSWELVTRDAMGAIVVPPPGAQVWVDGVAVASARATLENETRVEVAFGAFTVRARRVADEAVATSWVEAVEPRDYGGIAASVIAHGSIFAALALFLPPLGATDDADIGRDRMLTMQHLLDASAMREEDEKPDPGTTATDAPEDHGASGGARAMGAAGTMGTEKALRMPGHWSAQGDAPKELAQLSREEKQALVRDFSGAIGLIATLDSDPNAPTVPWGERLVGADADSHRGSLFGAEAADTWGIGGLTISGTDEGGGGSTIGVGINDVGDLGKSLENHIGSNAPGGGWGHECGSCRLADHHVRTVTMRMPRDITTNGRLPPEIIQRIVRQNAGRFRACYESGLRTNPSLAGRVVVKFMIDRTGQVSVAQDGGSDLPNAAVNKCIVQSFFALSFPTPDGGAVSVTYPIALSPAE